MRFIPRVTRYLHRTIWVATGLLCYYVAIDGVGKGRTAGDFIVLVGVGTIFLALTGWVYWRERRERELEDATERVAELTELP